MNDNHEWLLASDTNPPAQLSRLLLERYSVAPPVPVDEILTDCANLEEHPWSHDCDALVVGLLGSRPTVFIKAGLHVRRRRFTLAHELGHIAMEWHIGELVSCNPKSEDLAGAQLEVARSPEEILANYRIREQESEATKFAAHLLMPDSWLRRRIGSSHVPTVLAGADEAEVSAEAFLHRLRGILQPGFAFILTKYDGSQTILSSSGTNLPANLADISRPVNKARLAAASVDCGETVVAGRRVSWFRLVEFTSLESIPEDSRRASDILREIIHQLGYPQSEEAGIFNHLNGVASGSLSKERALTAKQALAILQHKFANSVHRSVVEHPGFMTYLRRKAEEWSSKRGLPLA